MDLKEILVGGCGVYLSGSGQGPIQTVTYTVLNEDDCLLGYNAVYLTDSQGE